MKIGFSTEEKTILNRLLSPKYSCKSCEDCKGCPILKIGEVASIFQITPDAIRYYEREGLISSYRDSANNYRLFDLRAVMAIFMIRMSNFLTMPIKNVKQIEGQSADPERISQVKQSLQNVITNAQKDITRAERRIKAAGIILGAVDKAATADGLREVAIRALSDAGYLDEYLNFIVAPE